MGYKLATKVGTLQGVDSNYPDGLYFPCTVDCRQVSEIPVDWITVFSQDHSNPSLPGGILMYCCNAGTSPLSLANWKSYHEALGLGWFDSMETKPASTSEGDPIIAYTGEGNQTETPWITVDRKGLPYKDSSGFFYMYAHNADIGRTQSSIVFRSRDLLNWEFVQIALDNPEGAEPGGGHTGYMSTSFLPEEVKDVFDAPVIANHLQGGSLPAVQDNGAELVGDASEGDSTINVYRSSGGTVNLESGSVADISGVRYYVTTSVTLPTSGSVSVGITPSLTEDLSDGESISFKKMVVSPWGLSKSTNQLDWEVIETRGPYSHPEWGLADGLVFNNSLRPSSLRVTQEGEYCILFAAGLPNAGGGQTVYRQIYCGWFNKQLQLIRKPRLVLDNGGSGSADELMADMPAVAEYEGTVFFFYRGRNSSNEGAILLATTEWDDTETPPDPLFDRFVSYTKDIDESEPTSIDSELEQFASGNPVTVSSNKFQIPASSTGLRVVDSVIPSDFDVIEIWLENAKGASQPSGALTSFHLYNPTTSRDSVEILSFLSNYGIFRGVTRHNAGALWRHHTGYIAGGDSSVEEYEFEANHDYGMKVWPQLRKAQLLGGGQLGFGLSFPIDNSINLGQSHKLGFEKDATVTSTIDRVVARWGNLTPGLQNSTGEVFDLTGDNLIASIPVVRYTEKYQYSEHDPRRLDLGTGEFDQGMSFLPDDGTDYNYTLGSELPKSPRLDFKFNVTAEQAGENLKFYVIGKRGDNDSSQQERRFYLTFDRNPSTTFSTVIPSGSSLQLASGSLLASSVTEGEHTISIEMEQAGVQLYKLVIVEASVDISSVTDTDGQPGYDFTVSSSRLPAAAQNDLTNAELLTGLNIYNKQVPRGF